MSALPVAPATQAGRLHTRVLLPCRRRPLRVAASAQKKAELQSLFLSRVQKAGWTAPKEQGLHPIAREAWASLYDIYGARVLETPLLTSPWLSEPFDAASVQLKAEAKQASGSYRARGAAHKLLALPTEQLARGVVASGSINHTLAVAHAAAAAAVLRGLPNVPTRFFLAGGPGAAALADKLRGLGGQVDVTGGSAAEADAAARAAAAEHGAAFIDAFNDPQVAGGLGSIAVELLMQVPRGRLDAVFVPVGPSGGLISGIAAVLREAAPAIKIVGCRAAAVDQLRGVLAGPAAGQVLQGGPPLPQGLGDLVDEIVEVGEGEAARAVVDTVSHTGMQVDAATGVAVAGFRKMGPRMKGKHVVVVVCGGNITREQLERMHALASTRVAAQP